MFGQVEILSGQGEILSEQVKILFGHPVWRVALDSYLEHRVTFYFVDNKNYM